MKKIFFILVSLALFFLTAEAQGTANFSISPPTGSYETGETIKMNIYVSPDDGQTIDTVRASMTFPTDTLEVTGFSYGSDFSVPAEESGYDNVAGTISYGGGIPGGITESCTFGTVTFRIKQTGDAKVELNGSSLILSEGENVYSGESVTANFKLRASITTPAITPTQTPTPTMSASPISESPSPSVSPEPSESESPIANVETETGTSGFLADIMAGLWGKIIFLAVIIFLGALGGLFWLSRSK
jgi:hypothetical protein